MFGGSPWQRRPAREGGPLTDSFDLSVLLEEYRDEARDQLDRLDAALLRLEEQGGLSDADRQALIRELHTLKGNSGMLGLTPVVDQVHAIESVFKTPPEWTQQRVDALFEAAAALRRAVERAGTDEQDEAFARLARVDLSPAPPAAEDAAPPPESEPRAQPPAREVAGGDLLRVPFRKLDALLNHVGELLTVTHALEELIERHRAELDATGLRRPLSDRVEELLLVQDVLRDATMELRLVPVARVFARFPKLARDLARAQGKQVRVVLEGEEVELDKSTVDALSEPLLHLVRNAVDHGIGTPAEREAAGAPATGTIWLRAEQRGDQLRIEVEDDGGGLDRAAIVARARQSGLLGPDEEPAPGQVDQLIFSPGFSTRAETSTVSGRGVGLDVVRRSVSRLRGSLVVKPGAHGGTRFLLCLPLRLAIVPALLFESGDEVLAVPVVDVQETLRRAAPERAGGAEVVRHRGELLPVARPARLFQWPEQEAAAAAGGAPFAIVLRGETRSAAILTPRLIDQRELVVKPVPAYLGAQPGVSGASVLPDGRVVLMLDAGGLLDLNLTAHQKEHRAV